MAWACVHTGDVHLDEDRYFGDTAQCHFEDNSAEMNHIPAASGAPSPLVGQGRGCGGRER